MVATTNAPSPVAVISPTTGLTSSAVPTSATSINNAVVISDGFEGRSLGAYMKQVQDFYPQAKQYMDNPSMQTEAARAALPPAVRDFIEKYDAMQLGLPIGADGKVSVAGGPVTLPNGTTQNFPGFSFQAPAPGETRFIKNNADGQLYQVTGLGNGQVGMSLTPTAPAVVNAINAQQASPQYQAFQRLMMSQPPPQQAGVPIVPVSLSQTSLMVQQPGMVGTVVAGSLSQGTLMSGNLPPNVAINPATRQLTMIKPFSNPPEFITAGPTTYRLSDHDENDFSSSNYVAQGAPGNVARDNGLVKDTKTFADQNGVIFLSDGGSVALSSLSPDQVAKLKAGKEVQINSKTSGRDYKLTLLSDGSFKVHLCGKGFWSKFTDFFAKHWMTLLMIAATALSLGTALIAAAPLWVSQLAMGVKVALGVANVAEGAAHGNVLQACTGAFTAFAGVGGLAGASSSLGHIANEVGTYARPGLAAASAGQAIKNGNLVGGAIGLGSVGLAVSGTEVGRFTDHTELAKDLTEASRYSNLAGSGYGAVSTGNYWGLANTAAAGVQLGAHTFGSTNQDLIKYTRDAMIAANIGGAVTTTVVSAQHGNAQGIANGIAGTLMGVGALTQKQPPQRPTGVSTSGGKRPLTAAEQEDLDLRAAIAKIPSGTIGSPSVGVANGGKVSGVNQDVSFNGPLQLTPAPVVPTPVVPTPAPVATVSTPAPTRRPGVSGGSGGSSGPLFGGG